MGAVATNEQAIQSFAKSSYKWLLVKERAHLSRPRRVLQFPQGLSLDLPDPLARHRELLPDLFQRVIERRARQSRGLAARVASCRCRSACGGRAEGAVAGKKRAGLAPGPFVQLVAQLDLLEVHRAGLVVAGGADVIGQALAGRGRVRLDVPRKGASLERQIVATGFRLDRALALVDVERVDGAKMFHRVALRFQATGIGACWLGDVED